MFVAVFALGGSLLAIGLIAFGGLNLLEKLVQFIYDTDFFPYKIPCVIGIIIASILMVILIGLILKSKNTPIKVVVGIFFVIIAIVSISGLVYAYHPEKTVELYNNYYEFILKREREIAFFKSGSTYCIVSGISLIYSYIVSKGSSEKM